MDEERLSAVAAELYSRRPEEFTAARTAAVTAARIEGDRALATAVKGLRRPSVAAWAVNNLVRQRPELVGQVVSLGASLREAQAGLQGDALRDLTRQRRQLVAAVTAEAARLAAEDEQRLSDPVTRQVEETLNAAMTDPGSAEAVRSGRLTEALSATGVESLALAGGPAVGGVVPALPSSRPSFRPSLSVVPDDGSARREAEGLVASARKELRKATKSRDKTVKGHSMAQARVLQLEAEVDELRRRLADAEAAAEAAVRELTDRESDRAEVESRVSQAEASMTQATAALEKLDDRS